MDVSYVNPFISSTIETFKTMFDIEAKPGKPMLKKEPYPSYDISAVIGLSGEAQGSISMSFPKAVGLKVISHMLGETIKVVGPELTDGIGEIANIVAGNAKKDLSKFKLSISLPNVIIGKDHVLSPPSNSPTIIVPFSTTIGDFDMEVSLKTK